MIITERTENNIFGRISREMYSFPQDSYFSVLISRNGRETYYGEFSDRASALKNFNTMFELTRKKEMI